MDFVRSGAPAAAGAAAGDGVERRMSYLTIAWSMCAGACAALAFVHLLLWLRGLGQVEYLLASSMSLAAAVSSVLELALMNAPDAARYGRLLQWENLSVYVLIVSLVLFVRVRFGSRCTWLIGVILLLWSIAMVVNFLSPYSVVFLAIERLAVQQTPWGEAFVTASGQANPWVSLTYVASLLILVYVIAESARVWRAGDRHLALTVGASIVLFLLLGGMHAPLVDQGVLRLPYMVSFAYLAIVIALAYELAASARMALQMQRQRAEALEEARASRDELERVARVSLLGQLAAGIAHELNQPLAAILSNAQAARRLLAAPAPDLDEQRAIVGDVARDAKRAGEVIHRMRALLQRGERSYERLSVAIVRDTVDLLRSDLQEHRIRVQLPSDDPQLAFEGDRVAIQQVILNLVSNAVRALRALPERKRLLQIALSDLGDRVCLSVADRGPGIEAKDLPHLFERFFSTERDSMGMGLAICQHIVRSHGGTIEASNRPGGGAEFRMTLPKAARHG